MLALRSSPPLVHSLGRETLHSSLKESLIDLSSDETFKFKFHASLSRTQFWLPIKSEYPFHSEQAKKILIQFSTAYLCEMAFSSVTAIKTRYRSQLEINAVLRLAVATMDPNTHNLISKYP
ncbi:uncharacterized protein TNCV_1744751 [Trichonephila clavipes]|nr:uncharacterized protein TNCV_1744751 [Trichonephila clavipes]